MGKKEHHLEYILVIKRKLREINLQNFLGIIVYEITGWTVTACCDVQCDVDEGILVCSKPSPNE